MTRLARIVFALLVVASGGAFFAAQHLKSAPSVVQRFQLGRPVISPNRDGRNDRQRVRFRLKRSDTVDVAVLDATGDVVAELGSGIRMRPYRSITPGLVWDGRDRDGHPVPDGTYRVRITLRDEGRSVVMQQAFRVDRTPPRPVVTAIGPTRERRRGPELLPHPGGGPAEIHLAAPARHGRVLLFRTDPGHEALVRSIVLREGATRASWGGTDDAGRRVAAGTYLAVAEVRDVAGNIGTSVPLTRAGLPHRPYGSVAPGHAGITVRDLAVVPPLAPARSGGRVRLFVDARGRPYTWTARRIGSAPSRRGRRTGPLVSLKVPGRSAGLFVFTATRDGHRASAPFLLGRSGVPRPVLVVAPLMTWQGRNPLDDDGDGFPNLLDAGQPVRLGRVLATPLPAGLAATTGPLFAWLDRRGHFYDATTDVALAAGTAGAPRLAGHRGVLLAGDARWLPDGLQRRLLRFVQDGGTLVSLGTGSLRRSARLTPRLRLDRPTPPADVDLFGSRIGPLQRLAEPVDLTNSKDRIGLFDGTEGLFRGFSAIEETLGSGTRPQTATAVTPDGRVVIVALRVGRGRVIRFGTPQLAARLGADTEIQALMERTWQLLSR